MNITQELDLIQFPSFDLKVSIELAANDPLLAKKLCSMMLSTLEEAQKSINLIEKSYDLEILKEQVHKLYGGCCYTGFTRLKYICQLLEQSINLFNHQKIKQYLKLFNQEIDYLIANQNKFLEIAS